MSSAVETGSTVEEALDERDQLVDALVATQDRLSALVAMMKVPSDTLDLDVLTDRMLHESLELTDCDGVILRPGDGRPDHRVLLPRSRAQAARLSAVLDEQLVGGRMGTGHSKNCRWAMTALPGIPDSRIAVARFSHQPFTTGDIRMLETVAIAIEQLTRLSELHQEVLRQAKWEKEHDLASRLAQAVLPTSWPTPEGVDFYARCLPANLTGGDFMVFWEEDCVLWFAIGDVAGKGLPAAMIMTQAVSAVKVALRSCESVDPAVAVSLINADLEDYLAEVGSFLTVAVACYVEGTSELLICNAGHSPVVHRSAADAPPLMVPPGAPPIGALGRRRPKAVRLPFDPGAALIVGTDGLVEQPNRDGSMLGYDDFVASCATGELSARDLCESLFDKVERHADGLPAADDRTAIVLVRNPITTAGDATSDAVQEVGPDGS